MSFFIVKQLPVLPPETYLQKSSCGPPYVQLVVPRVLELTCTSREMEGFAHDLGYQGPPFAWNEERRHALRSELDAIFAHMYGLDRSDMEWILETPPPGSSFPSLKQHEIKAFGEYRTQRLVLQAFDALARGGRAGCVWRKRVDRFREVALERNLMYAQAMEGAIPPIRLGHC